MPLGLSPRFIMNISLPSDFSSNVASSSSATIAGLSGYAELVIGVLLAALVISVLIGAIRGHH